MDTMAHGERGELLERSGELDVIRAGAEAVAAGEGRAVVVEGPAGIGKTALVAAARACAREAGLKPLGARATELERAFGYGVVRQLLEPAVHDGAGAAVFEGAARYAAALLDVPLARARPPAARAGGSVRRPARPLSPHGQPRRRPATGAAGGRRAVGRRRVAAVPGVPRGAARPARR